MRRARGKRARPAWRERSQVVRWWRLWRTRKPVSFTEKVRYKMLRDHRELVVTFADKAAARDYISSVVGDGHLPELYLLLDDPRALTDVELPDCCVVKPTHGSGVGVIVSDEAPAGARLPDLDGGWVFSHVRASALNSEDLAALCLSWTAQLYGQGPNREWAYGQIRPRIMVEELLMDADGGIPDDYKLFVFHGECRYIQVDRGRFGRRSQDFFTPDWAHLELSGGPPWASPAIPPPPRLTEMIELARHLGRDTDFVRVDLYQLADRVVVGELTNYPAGGDSPFYPESFNTEFGRWWTVPKHYRST